jgi:hypothetical protein
VPDDIVYSSQSRNHVSSAIGRYDASIFASIWGYAPAPVDKEVELDEDFDEEDVAVAVEKYGAYEPGRATTFIPDAPNMTGLDDMWSDEEGWEGSDSGSDSSDDEETLVMGSYDGDMNDLD